MSADIQLLALDRDVGERVVVRWLQFPSGSHGVEVGIERRELDGWRLQKRVVLRLSEIFNVHDAIGRACALAGTVLR